MKVKLKKLYEYSQVPKYATEGDAGLDLYLYDDSVTFWPGQRKLVSTGIAIELPKGYVGLIHPRSGLAHKYGITVLNTPGTIDSGYRGEIKVNLINLGFDEIQLNQGYRIAQLVVQRFETIEFEVTDELSLSERANGGHGSSGW